MCDRCTQLEVQIEELEFALRGAVWPEAWEITTLKFALKLTQQQARILLLLSKTKAGMSASQIGAAITESDFGANVVHTHMSRMYDKGLRSWVDSHPGRGGEIRLSPRGRRGVQQILEAERA